MNKVWMLIAAGILNIISGAVQLLVSIRAFQWPFSDQEAYPEYMLSPEYTLEGYLLRLFIPFFLSGVLAIGGGVNVVQRGRRWGLVWAGAIAASFPLLISWSFLSEMFALVFSNKAFTLTGLLGIASLILVGQYKTGFLKEIWRRLLSVNWMEVNKRAIWCYGQGLQRLWKYFPRLLLIQVITVVVTVVTTWLLRWLLAGRSAMEMGGIDIGRVYAFGIPAYVYTVFILVTGVAFFSLVCGPLTFGVLYAFLRAARGDTPQIRNIFKSFRNYRNVVLACFILSLIVYGGFSLFTGLAFMSRQLVFLLLILPEIILVYMVCRLLFTPYIVVGKKSGAVQAIKDSWYMTRGHTWTVFYIGLVWLVMSFSLISISLFFILYFFDFPVTYLEVYSFSIFIYFMFFAVPLFTGLYMPAIGILHYPFIMLLAYRPQVFLIVIIIYAISNILMMWAGLAVSSFYRVNCIVSQESDSPQ